MLFLWVISFISYCATKNLRVISRHHDSQTFALKEPIQGWIQDLPRVANWMVPAYVSEKFHRKLSMTMKKIGLKGERIHNFTM